MKRKTTEKVLTLAERLKQKVIGQDAAIDAIVPFVQTYDAGLSPERCPAGVFLGLGPTGTGKTSTVEALSEVLHGSQRHILRIDCGEYQMEHEVAKLIGAPPGYLGHRETHPVLTQARLASVTSDRSSLSLVLFDEVEKAAPSLMRILLGVLDNGTLRLGDNNVVNFERTMIFFTSNVGSQQVQRELAPQLGFQQKVEDPANINQRLDSISLKAAKKAFAPEFLNRMDALLYYRPLTDSMLERILDNKLAEFQYHINGRLGPRSFKVEVTRAMRAFLLEKGCATTYGGREIRRVVQKYVAQKVSSMMISREIRPGAVVKIDVPAEPAIPGALVSPPAARGYTFSAGGA